MKGALITVLICVLLVGGFVGVTQWMCIPLSAKDMEVTGLSQFSDDSIVFRLIACNNNSRIRFTITDDGCFYLTPMRSIIASKSVMSSNYDEYYVFFSPGFHTSEPSHPGIFLPENITKIYVGSEDEGILVWEYGMKLPAANEIVEQKVINIYDR